jgi:predicted ATPase
MLKRLILLNFKSVASASIDFGPFTFLVGRNGSGKSNIADALAFLSEITEWPIQTVFNRRGGQLSVAHRTPPGLPRLPNASIDFGLSVEFENVDGLNSSLQAEKVNVRYSFLLSIGRFSFAVRREQCIVTPKTGGRSWFYRDGPKFSSSVEFLNDNKISFVSSDALALPFVGGIPLFAAATMAMRSMAVYSIDPGKLREFQDPDAGRRLLSDGSNAASVLSGIKSDSVAFRRLFEILSTVVPDLQRVRPQTIGRKQHLRFYQQWSEGQRLGFDAFNMSDGTLRAFGILLALFQTGAPSLLMIEEPETSLHPAATAAIVETLRNESSRSQIIISTHSPEVLDLASPERDDFRVVTWSKGRTRIGSVSGAAKTSLQQHLASPGELFRMRILDAPPLFTSLADDAQRSLFEDMQ